MLKSYKWMDGWDWDGLEISEAVLKMCEVSILDYKDGMKPLHRQTNGGQPANLLSVPQWIWNGEILFPEIILQELVSGMQEYLPYLFLIPAGHSLLLVIWSHFPCTLSVQRHIFFAGTEMQRKSY